MINARNSLGKLEIRIHARSRIKKPCPQQQGRAARVDFVSRQIIGERQRARISAQTAHISVVGNLADFRISLPIAADIRQSVGAFGIWPKIRRQAHVIVLVTGGRRHIFLHHGKGAFLHCLIGGMHGCRRQRRFRTHLHKQLFLRGQYFCVQKEYAWKVFSNRLSKQQ